MNISFGQMFENQAQLINGPLVLRQGQIFFAHVHRLFPNNHAEISLGDRKLIASLEVPLESGKKYWLQVNIKQGEPQLRLLSQSGLTSSTDTPALQRLLSLPNEKGFKNLVASIKADSIPLSRNEMMRAGHWINQYIGSESESQLALEAIKLMSRNNMPFTDIVFKSIMAAFSKQTYAELISSLQRMLNEEMKGHPASDELNQLLRSWDISHNIKDSSGKAVNRSAILAGFKYSFQQLGLFYEADLVSDRANLSQSLKPALIKFLQEGVINPAIREAAEQIIHRMNGQQLLSFENGPVQQIIYGLPINLFGLPADITMHWSGQRTADGKLNADFCRILFYLHLENMKETAIDMQVQDRIVNVTVYNASPKLKEHSKPLLPLLRKHLDQLNYKLSSVHFRQPVIEKTQEKHTKSGAGNQLYRRVDFKV